MSCRDGQNKGQNGMDLTEAENIKNRWQEYTEQLYQKDHDSDNHDGDYSHETERCLFLGRKAMTNLDNIIKSRDITFANKGSSIHSYGFSSNHAWM